MHQTLFPPRTKSPPPNDVTLLPHPSSPAPAAGV